MAAVLVAGGLLFVKYKLEDLRLSLQEHIAQQVGADFEMEAVVVNGLRGLRIENLHVLLESEHGPLIRLKAPICRVDIDLIDLLYGQVNIDRIETDDAQVILIRPPGNEWVLMPTMAAAAGFPPLPDTAFRFVGNNCRIETRNLLGESDLVLENVSFDISRPLDAQAVSGHVHAQLGAPAVKPLELKFTYASPQQFDAILSCDRLAVEDITGLAPAAGTFLKSGVVHPRIRVTTYPNDQYMLHLNMDFQNLAIHDQPAFLRPATGTFTALGTYDLAKNELQLTTAKANTPQVAGELEGRISFAKAQPFIDLQLHAGNLPLANMMQNIAPRAFAEMGALDVQLEDPSRLRVTFTGPPGDLTVDAHAELSGGRFAFSPASPQLPAVDVRLGNTDVAWNSRDGFTSGSAVITGGALSHEEAGLHTQDITGTLRLSEEMVQLNPVNVLIENNPVLGKLSYDLAEQTGAFEITGTLANIENTLLGKGIKHTEMAGSAAMRCTGELKPDVYRFDLTIDATQAELEHNWWFFKPAGIGATVKDLHVEIRPRETITLEGDLDLATSHASFNVGIQWHEGEWRLETMRGQASEAQVLGVSPCLRIPYTLTGTTMHDGYFEWQRANDLPEGAIIKCGAKIDSIAARAEDMSFPIEAQGLDIDVVLDNRTTDSRDGELHVAVDSGSMPPFGETWFTELRQDPELIEKYPPRPRHWTFDVSAQALDVPPWSGTAFLGRGAFNEDMTDFEHFEAAISGEGRVEGRYHLEKRDNVSTLNARWDAVPASNLIQHLNFPTMLEAEATGNVGYTIDHDDPGTLEGSGTMAFRNGKFSADYLFTRFQDFLQGKRAALPPSLQFSQLMFDLVMDGDIVRTSDIRLDLQGITITGDGEFVVDADMNYTLKVAIAPETAAHMPMFQDYFNVEGHRVSQNDIELTFKISGPSFRPSSKVVGLPSVGVTVVSGAAEVGSEAFKVLDTPRQVLLDLFKIGGALVGTGR